MGALLDATKQMVVAVNAARELLEEARLSGNSDAIAAAAKRMSDTMNRLETNQTSLIEGVGDKLVDSFEKQLKAQALRDENFAANFQKIFGDGVGKIEDRLGKLNEILDAFKDGTIGLATAMKAIEKHMSETAAEQKKTADALKEAVTEMDMTNPQKLRDQRTGNSTYQAPDARHVAESSGVTPIPPADDGKR